MKLKASLSDNILLIPTLDIEIIWQTHLLRPEKYRNDCLRLFHRIIDHSLFIDTIGQSLKGQAFLDTCQLYQERFGEQYCFIPVVKRNREAVIRNISRTSDLYPDDSPNYSYWDATYYEFAPKAPCFYENPFSFTETDVISDNNWLKSCRCFMKESASNIKKSYRVSDTLVNLTSAQFVLLKKSYERFLYISAKHPPQNKNELLSATYAVGIRILVIKVLIFNLCSLD